VLTVVMYLSCFLLGFGLFAAFNIGFSPKLVADFPYVSIFLGQLGIVYISYVSEETSWVVFVKLLCQSLAITTLCIGVVSLESAIDGGDSIFREGRAAYYSVGCLLVFFALIKIKNSKRLNNRRS